MKFKCYDTCSLLEQAGHLFTSDEYSLVISSITLEELEHIKTASNKDADVKFAARKVLTDLDEHYGSFEIVLYNDLYGEKMLKDGISLTNDAKIIACARHFAATHPEDEVIFVTNDLICRHIASMYFTTEKVVEEEYDYDGYKEVFLDEDRMTEFYSNPEANLYDLHINEYLLVHNTDGECVDRLCWTGNGYRHLSYNSFNSRWFGDVKPMKGDVYQSLAADSLMNNKITLIKGPAGSGKTFLSLAFLMHKLERNKIDRIIDLNFVGFVPEEILSFLNLKFVGIGDLFNIWGHISILVGEDSKNYYIAESLDLYGGVVINTYSKSNVKDYFPYVVLMDELYKEDGNLTKLWY